MALQLAAYEPDIPQNLGALLRLSACFGVKLHVIEPCGFPFSDARVRRVGMDYAVHADWRSHASWEHFRVFARDAGHRLVLLTTRGAIPYLRFAFEERDILLLGRESAGVPDPVHAEADARVVIPLRPPARSLNVAMAGAIVLAEGLRQRQEPI